MGRVAASLQSIVITLWVGALWVSGFVVAPLLFSTIPDRTLAGSIAGKLFATTAWIGIACAVFLIILRLAGFRAAAFHQPLTWIVAAMLAFTLAGEFGVQPVLAALREQALPLPVMESAQRDSFAFWHGVAGILYAANGLLGAVLVVLHATRTEKIK